MPRSVIVDDMSSCREPTVDEAVVSSSGVDEKTEKNGQKSERKRSHSSDEAQSANAEAAVPEVHSANSWEEADMGGDKRKAKFLRLMGAGKVC